MKLNNFCHFLLTARKATGSYYQLINYIVNTIIKIITTWPPESLTISFNIWYEQRYTQPIAVNIIGNCNLYIFSLFFENNFLFIVPRKGTCIHRVIIYVSDYTSDSNICLSRQYMIYRVWLISYNRIKGW